MAETMMSRSPFGALVVLLAAVVGALCGAQWQQRAAGPATGPLAPADRAGVTAAGFAPIIEIEPFDVPTAAIRTDSENLFTYRESKEDKRRRAARDEEIARLARLAEEKRIADEKLRQDELMAKQVADRKWREAHPEPPAVTFALIGKIGAPRSPIAVLTSREGEIFTARVGETVTGGFKLLALDFDSATIGCADALVAAHPAWARAKTVLRMGAR